MKVLGFALALLVAVGVVVFLSQSNRDDRSEHVLREPSEVERVTRWPARFVDVGAEQPVGDERVRVSFDVRLDGRGG